MIFVIPIIKALPRNLRLVKALMFRTLRRIVNAKLMPGVRTSHVRINNGVESATFGRR